MSNFLLALLGLNCGNLMECQKKVLKNITESDSNFEPTCADHHLLPDMNFNGHCLMKNNISIPKKVIYVYFLHTRSTIEKFKHRFYIMQLLIWICKTKNADLHNYKYSGYIIGFDSRWEFSTRKMIPWEKMSLFLESM